MISIDEFRKHGHEFVDWMADFYTDIEKFPVKSTSRPGDILKQLPEKAPEDGESIDRIFEDFKKIILPGMTMWQSPTWMAYFQANSSYPSVLAEMLTATLGAQCMVWETSPAATELEERMMHWLKNAMGLPYNFHGVIQDTASTATLVALLSARERITDFRINEKGFAGSDKYRIYCSAETHSSIDKAVKIAGFGISNLVKIPVDAELAIIPEKLEEAIKKDLMNGKIPLCMIATIGSTGTMAIDPLREVTDICGDYDIWLHVDAAYAGSATILPEYRWMIEGLNKADSYVFNPHKWLFTNFDLSAYYVKDKEQLIRTFSIMPEYLKTDVDNEVNNYRDWGIQLGRRFRALKLWFVIRNFGLSGIRERFRNHISWVRNIAHQIDKSSDFELLVPTHLNMICFRYNPGGLNTKKLNQLNQELLKNINHTGKVYLTHTRIIDKFVIRLVAGQTYLEKRHVDRVWELIQNTAHNLNGIH